MQFSLVALSRLAIYLHQKTEAGILCYSIIKHGICSHGRSGWIARKQIWSYSICLSSLKFSHIQMTHFQNFHYIQGLIHLFSKIKL